MKVVSTASLFTCICFLCSSMAVRAQDIQWASTELDLGEIPVMEDKNCSFIFLNNSNGPLVVETVRTSCGCTEPQWPLEPVPPGQKGEIRITFTPNRAGYHHKKIKVFFSGVKKGAVLWIDAQAR